MVFDDYRAVRGIGADAVLTHEELHRFIELKASAGPIGDRASLTAAEYERSVQERGNFWPALAGKLAGTDAPREVVLVQYPAVRLKSDDVTLSGVGQVMTTGCRVTHVINWCQ